MSNTINWGKIQGLSYSPETNLTGTAAAPSFTNTKSIALDGVDDFVSVANSTSLNITSALSFSLWFNTSNSTATMSPISMQNKFFVQLCCGTSAERIRLQIYDGSAALINVDATATGFDDGQWHHLAVTTDALTTSNGVKVYLDNSVISQGTLANSGINSVPYALQIGRHTGTFAFDGNVDEVSLFNSELSASDVSTIYGTGVPNDIASLSPLSWWRCGDGDSAPTLTDNGSGGNNGTMTNFTTFSTDVPT
jgi:hypothetical protein